ncbi:HCP-like protein [Rhizophagus irregularis]|nr:HCP-like protein [Rhizophagus irregularis]
MAGRIEDGRWLAPEKLIDPKYRYDHKCEIFSFGMLLWELTFERKPYEDMELEDILDHVISGEREKIQFENSLALPDSSDAKIQKGFEEIIKEAWNQDPNIRISITKLLIQLDDLSKKYVKPGCSPGLEPQEIANFDIPSNSLNDKGDEIPDDVDFSNIDVDFEPLIPISEGVKAYKEKNHEKAWKCFNEQAENQNSLGKYWKAFYLWGGLFNQKDKLAALALYKEAADDGITDAQYRYAFALLDKDIKSKIQTNSKEESVKYLRIAAENGSGSAQFQIGEGYYNGNLGYAQNLEMAKLWYKRAALKDDKKAKERLKALGVND